VRTLTSLLGNSQRLDGGAMFGNAPRALWSQWIPPDERHRIPLSCRCLLVRDGERHLLFEAGIGAFFDPKLKDRYGVVEDRHVLLDSLAAVGLAPENIDVVVFSHLHFDHAGGALSTFRPDAPLELAFPRATFVVGRDAWQRAQKPHPRDRASFVPRLQELLDASGRLELVDGDRAASLGDGYRFHISNGHTPGLLLGEVDMPAGPVVFAADLIPGRAWVHLPITMGYDRYPEMLIEEKQQLLDSVIARKGRLFYTHDHEVALSRVSKDADGRYRPIEPTPTLRDLSE
jgi:glyoxylase-like metal-dependent hydrolase (beta-lactamase superfamily II)